MADAKLNILINAKDNASHALGGLKNALGGIAQVAGGILAAGAIQEIGRQVIGLAKDSITAASDLNETWNKVGTVFGDATGDVKDFVSEWGTQLGQSQQQMLDAMSTFGVFGKAAGLTGTDLSNFSGDLVELSSDLASFYNTSPEEAIQAIGSALRGESEPLRKYGVLLDDATMRQKALELGLISSTKEALTPANKVLAANAVIMEQTKDAQGDFVKTSDGLANSQRIVAAQFADLKTQLGQAFLPIIETVARVVSKKVMPALMGFVEDFIKPAIPRILEFADGFSAFLDKIWYLWEALADGNKYTAGGIITYLFGADAWEKIKGILDIFQPVIDGVWALYQAFLESMPMITETVQGMWGYLVETFQNAFPQLVSDTGGSLQSLADIWTNHGETIMGVIDTVWRFVVSTVTGAALLVSGIVQSLLTGISGAMDAWSMVFQGNWQGAMDKWNQTTVLITLKVLATIRAFFETALAVVDMNLQEFLDIWDRNLSQLAFIVAYAFGEAQDVIAAQINTWMNMGAALIQGLMDGIASKLNALLDLIRRIASQITEIVSGIWGVASPSKVFKGLGTNLMEGLALGIEGGARRPMGAAAGVATNITNITNYHLGVQTSNSPSVVTNSFNAMKAFNYG